MRMRTLSIVAIVALTGCAGLTPEDLGRSLGRLGAAAMPIGPEKETEIGRGIAATVAGRYRLLDDFELNRYVNLVGHAVAEQSPRRHEIEFRFGILDTDDVNAFAAPGGYILITRGALEVIESEAELAAVLGHEIGHVDAKHVLDEIRRADVLRTAQEESQLSGALLDQIAALGTGLLFTGLSREDELEADSLGILYAAATGYRVDGLPRFIEKLEAMAGDEGGEGGRLRELGATHPAPTDRLEALERVRVAHALEPDAGAELSERYRASVRGRP